MNLTGIQIQNFRNYSNRSFDFCEGINCISGLNGMGKTNLLEAVYYLCMGKGYFSAADTYNIRKGEIAFCIDGKFNVETFNDEIKVLYKNTDGKTMLRNLVKYQRMAEHVGRYPVVVIEPDDTIVIAEGGEARRKLFDSVISQVDKLYLDNLIQYNKVLVQRNSLLKSGTEHPDKKGLLDVYDEQLNFFAEPIYKRRGEILNEIKAFLNEMYHCVSGGKEEISVEYDSDMNQGNLKEMLKENIKKDYALQRTTIGIHRDDYELKIQTHSLKKYGSQGQKKSVMIALKLALYKWIHNKKEKKPLLLLDDVFDKLDDERVGNLFTLIGNEHFGQVFVTDTNKERMNSRFQNYSKVVNFISLP